MLPTSTASGPGLVERRARAAVAALFLTNGALIANLLPRYPEIKTGLRLDVAAYGLVVMALPLGMIVAGPAAAAVVRHFGSAKVAAVGTVAASLGMWAAVAAPSVMTFALALFLTGAIDAITDVGQNAHGLRVQRRYRRSILNSFHAVWSLGTVVGGGMAAGAIALGLPLVVHLGFSAALFSVIALVALQFCLPGRDSELEPARAETAPTAERRGSSSRTVNPRTTVVLLALVLIGISGTLVEDAGNTWATLYVGSLGAPGQVAPLGYIALSGGMLVGRLLGDRLVDRYGQRATARAGGTVTAAGMLYALAFPTVAGTIAGFAAAGLGVATLVPAAMHAADGLPGLRPGTGLTAVSWLMRLGLALSPPLVGWIAAHTELRAGLLLVPAAGVAVILLAGVLNSSKR